MAKTQVVATMLYKAPGPHHCCEFRNMDYKVIPSDEIEAAQADGWFLSPADAQAAYDAEQQAKAATAPGGTNGDGLDKMTRADLEAYAVVVGLTVKAGWNDAELVKQIRKVAPK